MSVDCKQKISLEDKKKEVLEQFNLFDDWIDKYEFLIDLAKNLEPYPQEKKTDEYLISGCQSKLWLDYTRKDENYVFFRADSEALITKGMIALLIELYSGRGVKEILEDDFSFIKELGLVDNLSPTRANGFVAMINKIKEICQQNLNM